jgi:ferrochelatase
MSFGSAATPEDVPAYLASVRRGRPAPEDVVAEFQRRYRIIGGSPLLRITREQASALEALLNSEAVSGESFAVEVGMRHAPPLIRDAMGKLAERGAGRVVAVVLSPQYSPIIMGGYDEAVGNAKSTLGPNPNVRVAGAWHLLPSFLDALAVRVREALRGFRSEQRNAAPVIMSAHSLPRSVADREPGYIDQLKETAIEVASRAGLKRGQWQFAYQSAGHTPQEWLRPDIKELFPALRDAGHDSVLIVPVQFLADHLEVLYDIDVAARAEAEQAGLTLRRTESLNTMPEFIRALADVVRREL